ncbi:REP element-mobilizing transposase RayT [Oribacterium sp. KHPX15]|uniref:transposase n=1 Tax=Oribacterium sp. KHPX15 TaxID=1855342 RepID=UPI00089B0D01|nr:transposase [Oribacterium sp. KHPX15]SEA38357.1 REP element-mobilizing transposase RayT [Oribacterium sp. KHPX15]
MARKKRIWYPGAVYHVMSRGNRRSSIFKEEWDYQMFIVCLKSVKELYDFKIYSICLMTNHFHMVVGTGDTEIWKIMHKLLLSYAASYNMKYKLTGHLFENRYIGQLIENETYLLEASRYIHLNPVKAQMVREPLSYKYSSYADFVSVRDNKSGNGSVFRELTDTSRVLGCFRNNPAEQYRMFVEGKISHAEQEMLIQKDMKEDDMWLPW